MVKCICLLVVRTQKLVVTVTWEMLITPSITSTSDAFSQYDFVDFKIAPHVFLFPSFTFCQLVSAGPSITTKLFL